MSSSRPTVAVLATINTKNKEARFVADVLARAGAIPWIVDLSMKAHDVRHADVAARRSPRPPARRGRRSTSARVRTRLP